MFDLLKAIKEQEQHIDFDNKPVINEEKTAKIIDLIPYLNNCCRGLNTRPEEIKKKLLNQGNIEDIISGDIPVKCIRAHIQLWIVEGKKKISGNKE